MPLLILDDLGMRKCVTATEDRLLLRSNQEWAVDFAYDALATGHGIRILTDHGSVHQRMLDPGGKYAFVQSAPVTRALLQVIEQVRPARIDPL